MRIGILSGSNALADGSPTSDRNLTVAGFIRLIRMAGHEPVVMTEEKSKYPAHSEATAVTSSKDFECDHLVTLHWSPNFYGGLVTPYQKETLAAIVRYVIQGRSWEFNCEDGRVELSWKRVFSKTSRAYWRKAITAGIVTQEEADQAFEVSPNNVIYPRETGYREFCAASNKGRGWWDAEADVRWLPTYSARLLEWQKTFDFDIFDLTDTDLDLAYVGAIRLGERQQDLENFFGPGTPCTGFVGGTCTKSLNLCSSMVMQKRVAQDKLAGTLRRARFHLTLGNKYLTHLSPQHRFMQSLAIGRFPVVLSKWDEERKNALTPDMRKLCYINSPSDVLELKRLSDDNYLNLVKAEWEEQIKEIDDWKKTKHAVW